MELKTDIICKNFEQVKIDNNIIEVDEQSYEYYVIPLNKSFSMEYDDEVFKLTFINQQLWLKYSNHHKEIKLHETDYEECVLIKSEDVMDICSVVQCDSYVRKNTWHSLNINVKKKYVDEYFLVIPIIEDMIDIRKFGVGDYFYQIEVITNEVLMKKVKHRGLNGGNITINNNINLWGEALLIKLNSYDVKRLSYVEK